MTTPSNEDNMNFLFYVGIIVPTLITVTLFLIFIYCWVEHGATTTARMEHGATTTARMEHGATTTARMEPPLQQGWSMEHHYSKDGAWSHHYSKDGAWSHHYSKDGAWSHHYSKDGAWSHHYSKDGAWSHHYSKDGATTTARMEHGATTTAGPPTGSLHQAVTRSSSGGFCSNVFDMMTLPSSYLSPRATCLREELSYSLSAASETSENYTGFLQKARKEVLTKKYDPHGKMRRLGISLDPPPPPSFCRMEESLLPENGEDNVAYDVSRSPSTEQDGRGRPMYHTYHDSGISAGLSPSQESEPRPGLAYRTCPDSGISGFGLQPTQCSYNVSRGCCEEPMQRQSQEQQVLGDQMQINMHQQQPYHQQLHQPQAVLHHNLIQASVHPTHGVCYGDDMNHPQSPQHYTPPVVHPTSLNLAHYNERQISLVAHVHTPPIQHALSNQQSQLPFYSDSPGYQIHHHNDQQYYRANEIIEHPQNINHSPTGRQGQDNAAIPTTSDPQFSNRTMLLSSGNFPLQSALGSDTKSHRRPYSSSPIKPLRHSNRDSNATNNAQTAISGADRPDSQASQSSTTDSEDSGFRSSHCAANHNARLNKHGNPLLKPLRRTKNKSKANKIASPNTDIPRTNGATPLITLNPQSLQTSVDSSNVIQNTSLMDLDLAHRPSRILQQNSNSTNSISNDRVPMSSSVPPLGRATVTFHDPSPIHTHQHSPTRDNWPPQSTNDEETSVNQNIDLNDISTHLSWKYLQDLSSSNNTYNGAPNGGMIIQPCHQGIRSGQIHQNNPDQHMEMFGFSVV